MQFWQHILQALNQQKKIILLYVLKSKGSSPGRQGFKMMVAEDGEMMGSIGGGIMEHKLVELAKSKLKHKDWSIVFKHQIHSKSVAKNQSGMICSGEQSVTLIPILPKNTNQVEQIIDCLQKGETATLEISPKEFKFIKAISNTNYAFNLKSETDWHYTEKLGFKKYAYIIGGGHVSKALNKVLVDLEFHCTLIDNRQNLNTLKDNTYAHQKIVVDYHQLNAKIREGDDVFIFIMTFGYRTDLVALQQLINKKVAYLGMMGSEEKIKQLIEEMNDLGYENEELSKVHSPIGLPIKSRTPQEIAISIAAQLIQLQNKDLP